MRDHDIEKEMYRQAVALIERRYPTGWGGTGVVHTADRHYFTPYHWTKAYPAHAFEHFEE